MLPELSIVKLFLSYAIWDKYKDKLSLSDLVKEVQPIYSVLDNFHRQDETKSDLSVVDLSNLLFTSSAKDKEYYLGIMEQLDKLEVNNAVTTSLIDTLLSHKKLKEISLAAYDVTEGKMSMDDMNALLASFIDTPTVQEDEPLFVTDDLEVLASEVLTTPGLRWRLKTLNEIFGSLRKGDFGFVFARPETGKTTFLASETTYMAEQLSDDAGPILWFNNEEQGNKVKIRCYQASLGLTLPQLLSDVPGNRQRFLQKTKGKHKLFDSGNISRRQVEDICKQMQPSLVIFDQIDKIQGFTNDREDLRLGAIYTWGRELAKKYCPVIAVCQADGTGEGVKWLTMGHVANAKTAKQAEADWILGVGKIHDPGYESVRYLHASKNKLSGDPDTLPDLRHGRREVLINASVARYEDI